MFCALYSVSYLRVQTVLVVHIDTYREVISVKEIEKLKKCMSYQEMLVSLI